MSSPKLTTPMPLSRATSRTRTARHPLNNLIVTQAEGSPNLSSIYAGPVIREASSPFVSGSLICPFSAEALQIFALSTNNEPAALMVILDLGEQHEVSRIEFYGNLLLPPVHKNGRPVHNFGLPRAMAVAVAEEFILDVDLHRRLSYLVWLSQNGEPWHPRHYTQDFRALWGWTPIHLPPTFGRYLLLYFWDLPLVYPDIGTQPCRGVDIQRLVLYPCLHDVDHRPEIEFAPIASWQSKFGAPSRFWSASGIDAPTADSFQSVYRSSDGQIMLPSVLAGISHQPQDADPVPLFSSDVVTPDSDERVSLILQTTTDETPLVCGASVLFEPPQLVKAEGNLPDYRIAIHTTNDPEAAWSSDPNHPSWRLALAPRLVRASAATDVISERLMFPEVHWARYVKLTVEVIALPGLAEEDMRFTLLGLSLLRPRDYVITPEEDQDMRVEYVVVRLRGADLFADYAFLDGTNGVGLTLESQEAGGPVKTLYTFHTLLDLLENTQHRALSNQRYVDKPTQILRETVDSDNSAYLLTGAETSADTTATVRPEFGNRQVIKSGSVTDHTADPRSGIDGVPFTALQYGPLGWVETERKYGRANNALPSLPRLPWRPPNTNPATIENDLRQFSQDLDTFLGSLESVGRPVSVSLGVSGNLAWNPGISIGEGATLSASLQVGGGFTRSQTLGPQGSISTTESHTTEAQNRQQVSGSQSSFSQQYGTVHDERRIERVDESVEQRRPGVAVQYGGKIEDILLAAIPLNLLLHGATPKGIMDIAGQTVSKPVDVLRVRVDHLPPGVTLDVEFRGSILPQERGA